MKKIVLGCALFCVIGLIETFAQVPGTCPGGEAEAFLDVNNVRARIFNTGTLFWKGGPAVYEVPKDSGAQAIYAANIWVGGRVESKIQAAAALYGRYEFWPGPLDDDGNPPADCASFDHLYEITQGDLSAYDETGNASANMTDWPWHLGAPVVDGDGIGGNYDLAGGDRPALIGDQMLWWVMNDAGNTHETTLSAPMGLEVQGSAFSYNRPNALANTTFYQYKLRYKGHAPLEDAYFGLWIDADLGDFDDDLLGSDTTLHLGFFYNGDNFDEGEDGYGEAPPAVGATFIRGARLNADGLDNNQDGTIDEPGERSGMNAFTCLQKTFPPQNATQVYNHLQGLTREGDPQYVGGSYWDNNFSATPTLFCYPGDPVAGAFWSMENIDGAGEQLFPHDMRFLMSTGPFTMQPGDEEEIAFAIVWARGDDRLDSVRLLKKNVGKLHRAADAILHPDTLALAPPLPHPETAPLLDFRQNYPNPFSETTLIPYSLPKPLHVRLAIYDVLGREVAVLVDALQNAGRYAAEFDARALPPGIYLARFDIDASRFTKTMLVIR